MEHEKIVVKKDGPFVVTGAVPLDKEVAEVDFVFPIRWKKTGSYPLKKTYQLCRCGKSRKMPYCDGTHTKTGFDGTETADTAPYMEGAKRYEGPEMDLTDNRPLCSSARFCDRKGGTWHLTKKSDDPKAKDLAIQQACDCPSGRLVAWEKDQNQPIEPKFDKSISVTEDPGADASGPLWVKGGIPIVSEEKETTYEIRNRVTLCRCGASKNKPFCDSSHIETRFNDGDESIHSST